MTQWYVVMTKVRKEWLAKKNLEFQGFKAFFPHYTEWTRPSRAKPRLLTKPYFVRYIFAACDGLPHHSVYTMNNTIGVSSVVTYGAGALELPGGIVEEIMDRTDDDGHLLAEDEQKPQFPGIIGDYIRFSETSPLFGFLAQLKGVDNNGTLMVKLDKLLGAEREVSVSVADVGEIVRPDGSLRPYEPSSV